MLIRMLQVDVTAKKGYHLLFKDFFLLKKWRLVACGRHMQASSALLAVAMPREGPCTEGKPLHTHATCLLLCLLCLFCTFFFLFASLFFPILLFIMMSNTFVMIYIALTIYPTQASNAFHAYALPLSSFLVAFYALRVLLCLSLYLAITLMLPQLSSYIHTSLTSYTHHLHAPSQAHSCSLS